jgi:transcriptional regulator with XRE-family HTH domain
MAVTNNIREIREQRGIYQDDLAAAIGYSSINSADGVLFPRSILPTVLVLYPIAAAKLSAG